MRTRQNMVMTLGVGSALAAVGIGGCTCVKFDDLTAGTQYTVPSTVTTTGQTVSVEPFPWGSTGAPAGHAKVDSTNHALGTGNAMRANNVSLRFSPAAEVSLITLKFADLGGSESLMVNGDFRNVQHIVTLHNTTIGGATVTFDPAPPAVPPTGNTRGTIKISGPVTTFAIGGQELWIDDVCWR